jgi:signal transduction histidine kinase
MITGYSTSDESTRLDAVRAYEEIGAPDQPAFKEMARLIRELIGAFDVGISMVRETEVRYYSCLLEKDPSVPRDIAFSSYAILQNEPLIIEDLSLDDRFKDNPFVKSSTHATGFTMADGVARPYRFYAGFQLRSMEGLVLGALYLLDIRPRKLDPIHIGLLSKFAKLAQDKMHLVMELELRKHDQNALIFAEKMSAVGRLVAGIAHEINTPLQFIKNNTDFLIEGISSINKFHELLKVSPQNLTAKEPSPIESPKIGEIMREFEVDYYNKEIPLAITQSAEGIKRISDLVLLLKTHSHSQSDSHSDANLNDTVRFATEITRYEWKNSINVRLNLDESLPLVACNSSQISQVILNLVTNSIDAIRDQIAKDQNFKGRIELKTYANKQSVIIQVEDNGGGIPADVIPKLFEPFFTTKEVGKGTGQGLAICWDIIVRKHRGTLEVNSNPEAGTTIFEVILPTASPKTP